jgi:uncharacterized UPF0160 family protein
LEKDWERADFVIDVGAKYDGIKWFDHHQPESTGRLDNGTGYSAFGLLWKKMGISMVREVLTSYNLDDLMLTEIAEDMESFVMGIDLHDQAQLNINSRWSINKQVHVEVASLQSIISGMNSVPFIEKSDTFVNNQQFYKALELATNFLERLVYRKASRVMANKYVASRIKQDANILYLEEYCEWYDAVSNAPHIQYVVYPSSNGKAYTVQAVKAATGANTVNNLRTPFPATWAGLSNTELAKVSNVPNALFCHRDRFIASASTLEGALRLADESIKQSSLNKK